MQCREKTHEPHKGRQNPYQRVGKTTTEAKWKRNKEATTETAATNRSSKLQPPKEEDKSLKKREAKPGDDLQGTALTPKEIEQYSTNTAEASRLQMGGARGEQDPHSTPPSERIRHKKMDKAWFKNGHEGCLGDTKKGPMKWSEAVNTLSVHIGPKTLSLLVVHKRPGHDSRAVQACSKVDSTHPVTRG